MPKLVEEELPKILIHTGALKFGMFTLSSGKGEPVSYTHLTLPTICSV